MRFEETLIHGSRKNSKGMHEDSLTKFEFFLEILTFQRTFLGKTEIHAATTLGGLGDDVLNI